MWQGALNTEGYGVTTIGQRQYRVHRLTYVEVWGYVPEGLDVGHLCHDEDLDCQGGRTCPHRACHEITHLAPMTRSVNVLSGENGRHTMCPQGHARSPGQGDCLECNKQRLRQLYQMRRSQGLSTVGTPYVRGPYKGRKEG